MAEVGETAEGVRVAEFGLQDDLTLQRGIHGALPRETELALEICVVDGDGFHAPTSFPLGFDVKLYHIFIRQR